MGEIVPPLSISNFMVWRIAFPLSWIYPDKEPVNLKTYPFKIPSKTLGLLKKIGKLADERGEVAYAVGGFVRDLFLRHPGVDIDITVEGDGITFAEKLAKLTGSEVEAFTRFG